MKKCCSCLTPAGGVYLGAEDGVLISVWFMDMAVVQRLLEKGQLPKLPEGFDYDPFDPVLEQTREWMSIYNKKRTPDFLPPLAPADTPFRAVVRDILLRIPFGEKRTYGEIAAEAAHIMGHEHMSAQAVGGALAHNPFPVIVPCHRVVAANGRMIGYNGGVHRQAKLLGYEGSW